MATTVHELKEDPETLSVVESVEASDNVVVVIAHLHNTKLIGDDLSFLSIFGLNKLQSILFTVIFALNQENPGETSVPYFLDDFVVFGWIFLREMSSRL